MIGITGYGVVAEKLRVGKLGQIFPSTVYEKLCVCSKMNNTFYDGHEERRLWVRKCGVCFFLLVTLRVRSTVLSRGAQFEQALRCCLLPLFCLFLFYFILFIVYFFQKGLLFQTHYLTLIFVTGWRNNFRKIALKKCEKSKNRRKRLCPPLRTDS